MPWDRNLAFWGVQEPWQRVGWFVSLTLDISYKLITIK